MQQVMPSKTCCTTIHHVDTSCVSTHSQRDKVSLQSAALAAAFIAAMSAWLMGGAALLLPVCCVGAFVCYIW